MKFLLTTFYSLLIVGLAIAQSPNKLNQNLCSVSKNRSTNERQAEALIIANYKKKQITTLRSNARASSVVYTIPVVFHLIESTPSITDNEVYNALASLNNAFSNSGDEPNGVNFSAGPNGADTQIAFCMAEKSPDGGISTGITRTVSEYSTFDVDLEDADLKTLLQWDPRHYLNIWIVTSLDSELSATYRGRTGWERTAIGGYGTLPGSVITQGSQSDGVVAAGLGAGLLAHECGHYLGLLHTFVENECINNDCTLDGDMVCDTPPDNTTAAYTACGGGQANNSCSSDTLTIQPNGDRYPDIDDMYNNFMDYGNAACSNSFTKGQSTRMLALTNQYRTLLYTENPSNNNACSKPCNSNVAIKAITPSELNPVLGNPITYTSNTTGVTNYEWYIEQLGTTESNYSIVMETGFSTASLTIRATTPNITYSFPAEGKYRVYLKAWDSTNPSCFTSSSNIIKVGCGVDARFYPDKRFIASKQSTNPANAFLDSVLFKNRSIDATNYDWTVTHTPFSPTDGPALPVFTSTNTDLQHVFLEPGNYNISLKASDGACEDTQGPFTLEVVDPTMDGYAYIGSVNCFNNDSLKVKIIVVNHGYDTISIGTPVSFYNLNPKTNPSATLLKTFNLPKVVYGFDGAVGFDLFVKANTTVNSLYAMFNDDGSVLPVAYPSNGDENIISTNIVLPPSGYSELSYNNLDSKKDFQFALNLQPLNTTQCANSSYPLNVTFINGGGSTPSANWQTTNNLSCTNCLDPTLAIATTDITKKLILTSQYGCTDSATVNITVPYSSATITNPPDVCLNATPPTLLATGNNLTWYTSASGGTGSTTTPTAITATAGSFNFWVTASTQGCEGPRIKLTYIVKSAPTPSITNPADVCLGSPPPDLLNAVANNNSNLLWYTSATAGSSSATPPATNSATAGMFHYWVSQTANGCESQRAEIIYNVIPIPDAPNVVSPNFVCVNSNSPNLANGITGANLMWYADTLFAGSLTPPVLDTDSALNYSYWATQSILGCESPKTMINYTVLNIKVTTNGPFEIDEGESQDISATITILPENLVYNLEWLDPLGQLVGTDTTVTVSPIASGTYTVIADKYGCSAEETVFIKVFELLYPTRAFSPNGDGLNDFWYIKNADKLSNIKIKVFNRWGDLVYQSDNYTNDWNGSINSKTLPIGTYYYIIDQSTYDRTELTGSITINY